MSRDIYFKLYDDLSCGLYDADSDLCIRKLNSKFRDEFRDFNDLHSYIDKFNLFSYKLIAEYPDSPPLNTVVTPKGDGICASGDFEISITTIKEYPQFWIEV